MEKRWNGMHYYGSYPGYPASSKMPKTKSVINPHHPHQVTSNPTIYQPYAPAKKPSSGGCGCGSKLPKR
jgi:hypothetical protein